MKDGAKSVRTAVLALLLLVVVDVTDQHRFNLEDQQNHAPGLPESLIDI